MHVYSRINTFFRQEIFATIWPIDVFVSKQKICILLKIYKHMYIVLCPMDWA